MSSNDTTVPAADPYLVPALTEQPCTPAKLVAELGELAVAGVRSYSIIGSPGVCDGVYPWDASAPAGDYQPIQVSAADTQRIQQAISAHIPDPPPPTTSQRVANALETITNDTALDPPTRTALADVVSALSGS